MVATLSFFAPGATDVHLTGGKGASLARLVAAGFRVPNGFTITTETYTAAMSAGQTREAVLELVDQIDHENVDDLDARTAQIRKLVESVELPPALAADIRAAYSALGDDACVAVRSSGTAEDTADSSFAGLHDTYLDVRGADDVLDAVKRCWASMWSARAVSYRTSRGFDHADAAIAVVVQNMVDSDVSGVMFTAHPLHVRTDEIVINASYGLGEAVVSGIVTPDEFTLDLHTLEVKNSHLGEKQQRIVRDAIAGSGTITQSVPATDRERFSLDPAQLAELGELGRRVMEHYDSLPQDIEWGLADGEFHLLQSRPITGVDFTWDEGIEEWQTAPDRDDALWTYKYSEQYWTGGITPLFYAIRARESHEGIMRMAELAGFDDLTNHRTYKYMHGTAYYNVDVDEAFQRYALPKSYRAAGAFNVPEDMVGRTLAEPLDVVRFLKMMLSVNSSPTSAFHNWRDTAWEFIRGEDTLAQANGLPPEKLRRLSDAELHRYLRSLEDLAIKFMDSLWVGTHIPIPMIFGAFGSLLAKHYKGTNALLGQELMSGLPPTLQTQETHAFHALAQKIRSSDVLLKAFDAHPGASFFKEIATFDEGRNFLAKYEEFVVEHGHRGHTDRDIYFERRADNPSIDYEAFRLHLQADNLTDPAELERRVIEKREAATEDVMHHLGKGTLGPLRQKLFGLLHQEILDFLVLREDWRHYIDRITYSKRKACLEAGRRAAKRGHLADADDCFFLGEQELFRVLAGTESRALTDAKVAGRRKAFDRMESRTWTPPMLVKGDGSAITAAAEVTAGGPHMVGIGTSAGMVEGRARVVPNLTQIGSLERGEILVCNATDPGWAPVFTVISGLVIETGGMLAHGSCLSREHGIPAVQLVNGMQLIPNGALIRLDGASGEVEILEYPEGDEQ